jgi:hypothetical protein
MYKYSPAALDLCFNAGDALYASRIPYHKKCPAGYAFGSHAGHKAIKKSNIKKNTKM